jgi:trehalose-6-phosphate synthase
MVEKNHDVTMVSDYRLVLIADIVKKAEESKRLGMT